MSHSTLLDAINLLLNDPSVCPPLKLAVLPLTRVVQGDYAQTIQRNAACFRALGGSRALYNMIGLTRHRFGAACPSLFNTYPDVC